MSVNTKTLEKSKGTKALDTQRVKIDGIEVSLHRHPGKGKLTTYQIKKAVKAAASK
ncbi:hypothetical protein [Phragmitibacter flavus]|uniref:hypothetical protein n=1 Tax=Phragmitibacter flavus TaxID=2576071 RepID=UPI0014082DB0|nr:hypothetical protein [Phragmitibacter flavus]